MAHEGKKPQTKHNQDERKGAAKQKTVATQAAAEQVTHDKETTTVSALCPPLHRSVLLRFLPNAIQIRLLV